MERFKGQFYWKDYPALPRYESQECFEAKVVKALDKIECLLQVLEYSKGTLFKNHLEFNISYGLKHADIDPAIKTFGEKTAQKMRDSY